MDKKFKYIDDNTLSWLNFYDKCAALMLLIISLALLIKEIQISAQALQHHIADIEEYLEKE